jgi:hypothetical protein
VISISLQQQVKEPETGKGESIGRKKSSPVSSSSSSVSSTKINGGWLQNGKKVEEQTKTTISSAQPAIADPLEGTRTDKNGVRNNTYF